MLTASDFEFKKIGDLEPIEMLLVVVEVASEKYMKNPFADCFKNWGKKAKRLQGSARKRKGNWSYLGSREIAFQNHDLLENPFADCFKNWGKKGKRLQGSERRRKGNRNYLGSRELAFQNHDLLKNPLPDSFKNCPKKRIICEETDLMVKKRRKIEQSIQKVAGPNPPPEIPEGFKKVIEEMKGTHIELVIQKRVFMTDVSKSHCRFSIPVRQVRIDFLREEEKRLVWRGNGNLQVMLIQPSLDLKPIELNFRKWVMPKKPKKNAGSENNTKVSTSYVLITNWNKVVKLNQLREGEFVQLWTFRGEDSRLCFAMVRVS